MKNKELLKNPFFNIQHKDRRTMLRFLYPTVDNDLLFYPKMDTKELLDEVGIPTRVGIQPYIITTNKELKKHLIKATKDWFKK